MRTRAFIVVACSLFAAAALVLASCSNARSCDGDGDCFEDEVCHGGSCLNRSEVPSNGSSDTGNGTGGGECVVDQHEPGDCSDPYEPNDEWVEATILDGEIDSPGCPHGPDFVPIEHTVSARMCAGEKADFYSFNWSECSDKTFRFVFELRPKSACSQLGLELFDCESDDVQCEEIANGGTRQTAVIQPSGRPQVRSLYPAVVAPEDQTIQVDYDLYIHATQ